MLWRCWLCYCFCYSSIGVGRLELRRVSSCLMGSFFSGRLCCANEAHFVGRQVFYSRVGLFEISARTLRLLSRLLWFLCLAVCDCDTSLDPHTHTQHTNLYRLTPPSSSLVLHFMSMLRRRSVRTPRSPLCLLSPLFDANCRSLLNKPSNERE